MPCRSISHAEKALLGRTACQKAISLKPQKAGHSYILGFVYSHKKQWNSAVSGFAIAVKKEPNSGEYLRGLSWATYRSGDTAKGLSLLKEANRLPPDNARVLTDLAVVSLSSLATDPVKQYAKRAVHLILPAQRHRMFTEKCSGLSSD